MSNTTRSSGRRQDSASEIHDVKFGFIKVPHDVLARTDLKTSDKLVFGFILNRARLAGSDVCDDTNDYIAAGIGVSSKTVSRSWERLDKRGLTECIYTDDKTDRIKVVIRWRPPQAGQKVQPQADQGDQKSDKESSGVGHDVQLGETKSPTGLDKKSNNKESPKSSPRTIKNPPLTPPQARGSGSGGGSISLGEEKTKADAPEIPADVLAEFREAFGDREANTVRRRTAKFIGIAQGDTTVVVAAIRATIDYRDRANSPVAFLVAKIKEFAADGIPDDYVDEHTRAERENAQREERIAESRRLTELQPSNIESTVSRLIDRLLNRKRSTTEIREAILRGTDKYNLELGYTADDAAKRRQRFEELLADEKIVWRQHCLAAGVGPVQSRVEELYKEFAADGLSPDQIRSRILSSVAARDGFLVDPLSESQVEDRRYFVDIRLYRFDQSSFPKPALTASMRASELRHQKSMDDLKTSAAARREQDRLNGFKGEVRRALDRGEVVKDVAERIALRTFEGRFSHDEIHKDATARLENENSLYELTEEECERRRAWLAEFLTDDRIDDIQRANWRRQLAPDVVKQVATSRERLASRLGTKIDVAEQVVEALIKGTKNFAVPLADAEIEEVRAIVRSILASKMNARWKQDVDRDVAAGDTASTGTEGVV